LSIVVEKFAGSSTGSYEEPLADRALDSHGDEIPTTTAAAATTAAATSFTMTSSFRSVCGWIVARADERTMTALVPGGRVRAGWR
jgi:hypothetical protein